MHECINYCFLKNIRICSIFFICFYLFRALEAILISVTSSMQSELEALVGPVNKLLNDLEGLVDIEESVSQDRLRDLLQFSKKLSKFEHDVLNVKETIEDLLEHGNT